MKARKNATEKSLSYQKRMPKSARIITKCLNKCVTDSRKDVEAILDRFAYKTGMSRMEAKRWLSRPVPASFIKDLQERARATNDAKLLERLENELYRANYTRKKALHDVLANHEHATATALESNTLPIFADVSAEAYTRTMYEIQKGTRIGFSLASLPAKRLERVAKGQMDYTKAKYYTARIIGDKLNEAVFNGIAEGKNPNLIGIDIAKTADVIPWRAKAIARTAITEISNEVEIDTMKEAGVTKFRFMATLDEVTCEICGEMDGKVFSVDDMAVGENCPPMHPNCRCTTTVEFTEEVKRRSVRSAKADGKWTTVPADMTYEEWKDAFLD